MHFADVRDTAAALVRVMQREAVRPVYHLPGTVTSIGAFYRMVAQAADLPAPRWTVPYLPALAASRLLHAAGIRILPEPALIEMASRFWAMESKYSGAELGYRSRPGMDTIRDTVRWLRGSQDIR
jgi:nucleoside-diphosphate-sugar epimerase